MIATKTKEKPVLMTPENAHKCYVGTKTQTRRLADVVMARGGDGEVWHVRVGKRTVITGLPASGDSLDVLSPYGPGERLWVRESCWIDKPCQFKPRAFYADGWVRHENGAMGLSAGMEPSSAWTAELRTELYNLNSALKRVSSIHMPRWACRTLLEVTGVKVERLNAISEEDARAEGCIGWEVCAPCDGGVIDWQSSREEFHDLWESIHGEGSWAKNPWVWAYTFKALPPPFPESLK